MGDSLLGVKTWTPVASVPTLYSGHVVTGGAVDDEAFSDHLRHLDRFRTDAVQCVLLCDWQSWGRVSSSSVKHCECFHETCGQHENKSERRSKDVTEAAFLSFGPTSTQFLLS